MRTDFGRERIALADIVLNLGAVVVVIAQGGMDVGERNLGMLRDDFIRRETDVFMPDRHILNADAMARDAGLPAADAGCLFDVRARFGSHGILPSGSIPAVVTLDKLMKPRPGQRVR